MYVSAIAPLAWPFHLMNAHHHALLAKGPEHARLMLYGLVHSCPHLGSNPDSCQLHAIRQFEFEKRLEWVKSLSDDQCMNYYRQHLECSACIGESHHHD